MTDEKLNVEYGKGANNGRPDPVKEEEDDG